MAGGSGSAATLLVATTGGHLEELRRLVPMLGLRRVEWITHDTDQARSDLAGERVHLVPYVGPRDVRGTLSVIPYVIRVLARGRFDAVVTTGAAVAVPLVLAARVRGIPCHYVESATRTAGPSLTGSMLSRVPGVRLYTQHDAWSGRRWRFRGSIFDGFAVEPTVSGPVHQVVVTLGTMRAYSFARAVERLLEVLPDVVEPGARVLWQTGSTPVDRLGIDGRPAVSPGELRDAIATADLVIAHAGIGSALAAHDAGLCPVLLPRRSAFGEHVDDHQVDIAAHLFGRGLAVTAEADRVTARDLRQACSRRIATRTGQRSFLLAN